MALIGSGATSGASYEALDFVGVRSGTRFRFGANWRRFVEDVSVEQLSAARESLVQMLGADRIRGKTFLDVGSGSGLFSVAAVSLGSVRVYSFEYDEESVEAAREMKRRSFPMADWWSIEHGDVLDRDYLQGLGRWDVVYAWGVLHHTGAMWQALGNLIPLLSDDGVLYLAVYNDQGFLSWYWSVVKRLYASGPGIVRSMMEYSFVAFFCACLFATDLLRRRDPRLRYSGRARRGMSVY
ncbi:MAG: hypothetical protein AUI63_03725, partial [Gemmatimonadetes bacterium 13_1_40CM_2_60_3]